MPGYYYQPSATGDDELLISTTDDLGGGMNDRQHPSVLSDKEAQNLQNVDLSLPGQRSRRPGRTLVEDLGAAAIGGMFNFDPQGETANLLVLENTNLKRWTGSGSFVSVSSSLTLSYPNIGFAQSYKTGVGDVALIYTGSGNVQEINGSYTLTDLGDTNTSPPKTPIMAGYRNRVWSLKSDLLYFSSAAPSDYSTAFDRTTNNFRIPCGEERALIPTRDQGLIILGKSQVWAINPSTTPAATDKPEFISNYGCAAGKTAVILGDDIYYFSFDGVRGIKRTEQDKLQYGTSKPVSYRLKSNFETINWAQITKACAVFWDNKYFLALPVSGSTYNNQVWVYWPSSDSWVVLTGWNVAAWSVFKLNGEERLYYGEASADGDVFRAWSGASDSGTAISWIEESRSDNLKQPSIRKIGSELEVVAKPSGNYNITVEGAFDNGSYNSLGTVNVSSGLITFPVTYPVAFTPDSEIREKFHLDSYGPFYTFAYKLSHNAVTTNADDITIYKTQLTAIPEKYESE